MVLKWYTYFVALWFILHTAVGCILWLFGILRGCLVYFSRFGMLYEEKSGNPDLCTHQGCQIFLGTTFPNSKKYTKLPQNKPIVHSVYQLVVK
jgi:hypothetical protein